MACRLAGKSRLVILSRISHSMVVIQLKKSVSLACLAIAWPAGLPCVRAATVTLPAVADTSLFESKPDADLGATTLLSGTNQLYSRGRALFRFDTEAIPAGAVISDVKVLLHVTRRPDPDQHGGPTDSDFSLYRLLVSWGEGTGSDATGSVATPGVATWNDRHFGSTAWASPGGQIGTDFANQPSATTAISDVGEYTWGSSSELVDDVNSWIANPASNHGFILISQSENLLGSGRRFGAIEQPGASIPPARLVVTYSVVPEPAVAGLCGIGLAGVLLTRRRPAGS
jgi:hypothetical protein